MIYYPAQFEEEFGTIYDENSYPDSTSVGFVVTFRDVPEAITQGDNLLDAIDMAEDALKLSMEFYEERGEAYPTPSAPQTGDVMIGVEL